MLSWNRISTRLGGLAPAAALVLALALPAQATRLYAVSADDDLVRRIDAGDAQTVSSVAMSFAGPTIQGANGLARNPANGLFYALLKLQGQSGRQLVTVDPKTGATADIGDTGERFASLAFDGAGTLYGVTGDGASTPESLFTLNLTTGAPSFLMSLGNGGSGEAIGFQGGLLYHASGPLGDEVFESVDLGALTTSNIPLSGDAYDEAGALTGDGAGGLYLADVFGTDLYQLTTGGSASLIGDLGFSRPRGLVFVPEPATGLLMALGLVALARRRSH